MKRHFPVKYMGTKDVRVLVDIFGYRKAIKILNREWVNNNRWFTLQDSCGLFLWELAYYNPDLWVKVNILGDRYEVSSTKSSAVRAKIRALLFRQCK